MTTLAVTSVSSLRCQASTCFRMGSKLRCIRSTPTEMQSMRENDFECFASTGVKSPANAMFEHTNTRYPQVIVGDNEMDRDGRAHIIVEEAIAVCALTGVRSSSS